TPLSFTLSGEMNRQGKVKVTFESWYASEDSTTVLSVPTERTVWVSLNERPQSGLYQGEFVIPEGTNKIIGLEAVLTDGQQQVKVNSSGVSIGLLGGVEVTLTLAPDLT